VARSIGLLEGPEKRTSRSSDRSFGIIFAVVFVIIALWPLMNDEPIRAWAVALAAAFLACALMSPALLAPLNRGWMAFGRMLHAITTPIIMVFLFYAAVTPLALLMRLFGKRPIPLSFDRTSQSYWIARHPPGPAPSSMKNQF
jgi:hypothetical protein